MMWSRLLVRSSLLAVRSPSVTKGEKLFSSIGSRLQRRSTQIRSTLPSFCKLYTTDLQTTTEVKNDIENEEENVEKRILKRSNSKDQGTSARSKTKRKNSRLTKNKAEDQSATSDEGLTRDENLLNQIKATKNNPRAVLQLFNQLEHKTLQTYTLAIKAHIDSNAMYAALELWHTMEKDPALEGKLNTMAYNKLMHIHHEMHEYDKMREAYAHITQHYRPNVETFHRYIMMATSPEVDSVEQVNLIASEMEKYKLSDFFLTYELFKFYAVHDMWDLADKYIAALKENKNLPPVIPLLLKVAELWKLVHKTPEATEEINKIWDEFNKTAKSKLISYYGRLLNEMLTGEILEHFLKHDDVRAHELLERVAMIMRESEARAAALRNIVGSAVKSNRLDVLADFEQFLVKHKRTGVIADLGFTYAYNGLYEDLKRFIESPACDGLLMSQLHHIVRGLFWNNTATKIHKYYIVPKEGFDTPEQHLKNVETVQDFVMLLNKRFGFVHTIETKTLMALGYIKARLNEQAREILADVDPEESTNFNLYKKTMKYLTKNKERSLNKQPSHFWRDVSQTVDNQDCATLKKYLVEHPLTNFSPSLLQRIILCFEKHRMIADTIDVCARVMSEFTDKIDAQLCKSVVRLGFTYKKQELAERALELFKTGPWQPTRMDFRVTNIVLNYYIFTKQMDKAEEFFQYCVKAGNVIRPFSFGRLLSQVLAQGRLRDAWIYFIQQRTCPLGPRSVDNNGYSVLINMLILNKLSPYAVALFESMKEDCVLPDRFLYKQFCDMIFGRKRFKDAEVQVLDASGQQVPPEQVLPEVLSTVAEVPDVKENPTGESIAAIEGSQKNLPKLLALMQLPLEGLPEISEFKLRITVAPSPRTPKM